MTRQSHAYRRRADATTTSVRSTGRNRYQGSTRGAARAYLERRASQSDSDRKPPEGVNLFSFWLWPIGMVTVVGTIGAITLNSSAFQAWQKLTPPIAKNPPTTLPSPPPTRSVPPSPPPIVRVPPTPITPPTRSTLSPEEVYQKVRSAVVTVYTTNTSGSGVFINRSGLLLTNEHVVKQSTMVWLKTSTGQMISARVLRVNQASDLAVVQATEIPHFPSCLAIEMSPVRTGQTVYALGSPLGIAQVLTQGIISGYSKSGEVLHSAPIGPGNSGSPLMNDRGHIVGINRAVFREYRSMSIAVPTVAIRRMNVSSNCDP